MLSRKKDDLKGKSEVIDQMAIIVRKIKDVGSLQNIYEVSDAYHEIRKLIKDNNMI